MFLNKDKTVVQKGSFTTCKKRDKCPPWIISADRVEHNKNKKFRENCPVIFKLHPTQMNVPVTPISNNPTETHSVHIKGETKREL